MVSVCASGTSKNSGGEIVWMALRPLLLPHARDRCPVCTASSPGSAPWVAGMWNDDATSLLCPDSAPSIGSSESTAAATANKKSVPSKQCNGRRVPASHGALQCVRRSQSAFFLLLALTHSERIAARPQRHRMRRRSVRRSDTRNNDSPLRSKRAPTRSIANCRRRSKKLLSLSSAYFPIETQNRSQRTVHAVSSRRRPPGGGGGVQRADNCSRERLNTGQPSLGACRR
uniref:Secreted protein n=1 Tax=Steinernema glaseri TaxID=37863 RepID=A0A1I8AM83_9BILA